MSTNNTWNATTSNNSSSIVNPLLLNCSNYNPELHKNLTFPSLPYRSRSWVVCSVTHAIGLVAFIYLCIVIVNYELQCRKERRRKIAETVSKHVLYGRIFSPIISVLTITVILVDGIDIFLGTKSDVACRIYNHTGLVMCWAVETLFYVSLWSRQMFLYTSSPYTFFKGKKLYVFNYLFLFFMLAGISGVRTISHVTPVFHGPVGCCFGRISVAESEIMLALMCVRGFSQVTLLCLMLYPLITSRKISPDIVSDNAMRKNIRTTRQLIKRVVISTTGCIFTDALGAVLIYVVHDEYTLLSLATVLLSNVFGCYVFMNLAYVDWRKRLLFRTN
uniref:uncharacterized protein LOC113475652 n=1 Tax=Ciona intestinalis TaxID=7719 RepID=UPI000EF49619|nr:uncharacterized protein LOC113475652 [Ciona intestinalis]|eukprot:XP_026695887.1 uncharacterized protein LOC113475652 [Ciona intestinalis]